MTTEQTFWPIQEKFSISSQQVTKIMSCFVGKYKTIKICLTSTTTKIIFSDTWKNITNSPVFLTYHECLLDKFLKQVYFSLNWLKVHSPYSPNSKFSFFTEPWKPYHRECVLNLWYLNQQNSYKNETQQIRDH